MDASAGRRRAPEATKKRRRLQLWRAPRMGRPGVIRRHPSSERAIHAGAQRFLGGGIALVSVFLWASIEGIAPTSAPSWRRGGRSPSSSLSGVLPWRLALPHNLLMLLSFRLGLSDVATVAEL